MLECSSTAVEVGPTDVRTQYQPAGPPGLLRSHQRAQPSGAPPRLAPDLIARRTALPRQGRPPLPGVPRSEERRVGKECRSRWWMYYERKINREIMIFSIALVDEMV